MLKINHYNLRCKNHLCVHANNVWREFSLWKTGSLSWFNSTKRSYWPKPKTNLNIDTGNVRFPIHQSVQYTARGWGQKGHSFLCVCKIFDFSRICHSALDDLLGFFQHGYSVSKIDFKLSIYVILAFQSSNKY